MADAAPLPPQIPKRAVIEVKGTAAAATNSAALAAQWLSDRIDAEWLAYGPIAGSVAMGPSPNGTAPTCCDDAWRSLATVYAPNEERFVYERAVDLMPALRTLLPTWSVTPSLKGLGLILGSSPD